MSVTKIIWFAVLVVFGAVTAAGTEAFAQRRSGVRVEGQVQAGGGPLASSTVLQVRATPNNWLKRNPAVTADLSFAPQARPARMLSCMWLPKVA